MKNTSFTKGILLGVGILGATSFIGQTAAQAAPGDHRDVKEARKDVKEAKKEVKQERKDLRRADTPAERREARQDLKDAKRDLREEKRDLRNEKRDVNRPNYNNGYRPNYNNGYRPGNYNNNYNNNNYRTIEGYISKDLEGNGFRLKTTNGQEIKVTVVGGEPSGVGNRDVIRAYGTYTGSGFLARSITVLRNR